MQASKLLVPLLVVAAACGSDAAADQATSARNDVELPPVDAPTRVLSPELPGDDPAFRAAIDRYDGTALEAEVAAEFGVATPRFASAGYFGQAISVSFWLPVDANTAMAACHLLVDYVNEIDFPATSIEVEQHTYEDLTVSTVLAAVDDTGHCNPV